MITTAIDSRDVVHSLFQVLHTCGQVGDDITKIPRRFLACNKNHVPGVDDDSIWNSVDDDRSIMRIDNGAIGLAEDHRLVRPAFSDPPGRLCKMLR